MKKLLGTLCAVAALASFTALGQGYMTFGASKGYVWNATNGVFGIGAGGSVTYFWAPQGTLNPLSQTATNASSVPATFWASVQGLTAAGWTQAVNAGTSATVIGTVNASGVTVGGIAYNGGSPFQVTGTSGGVSYEILAVAWMGGYGSIAAAALANANGGVSSLFNYLTGAAAADPASTVNFNSSGMTQFGVAPVTVPEPGTLALAALGGASLLLFRRRK